MFAGEFAVTALCHPSSPSQVGVVDPATAHGLVIGIQTEQDPDDFAPVGVITGCVEQPEIEHHMVAIIGREVLALRRLIQKWPYGWFHGVASRASSKGIPS